MLLKSSIVIKHWRKAQMTNQLNIDLKWKVFNFIKKETLTQVLFCEFFEIFKNASFTEHFWTTASGFSSELVSKNFSVIKVLEQLQSRVQNPCKKTKMEYFYKHSLRFFAPDFFSQKASS